MKSPGAALVRNFPALSHAGNEFALAVFCHQTFIKIPQNITAGHFGAFVGIERGRLRAVAALECLCREWHGCKQQ